MAVGPDEPDVGYELVGVLVKPDVPQLSFLGRVEFFLHGTQVHGVGDDTGVVRNVERDWVNR